MKFGNIQGILPLNIVSLINDFNSVIDPHDLYFEKPLNYPPHVTIISGIDKSELNECRLLLDCTKLKIDKVKSNTYVDSNRNLGILWLELTSQNLIDLHDEFANKFNLIDSNVYLPHISCAFVKPESLDKYQHNLFTLEKAVHYFEIHKFSYLLEDGGLLKDL